MKKFLLLVASFASLALNNASAAIIPLIDRTTWETAVGPTTNINFSTYDNGDPITNPPANQFFSNLTLRGVTFQNVRSYFNNFIYAPPEAWATALLPNDVYYFGVDLSPIPDAVGEYAIRVSSGGDITTFSRSAGTIPEAADFFGVLSTTPIDFAQFSLDVANVTLDNFAYGPPSNTVPEPGVPALLLLGLAGVAVTRRHKS